MSAGDLPDLNPCGCCAETPAAPVIDNPRGQPALAFRIGTHATFLARMKERLARQTVPPEPLAAPGEAVSRPLLQLTTRSADDPAIALLDAWAAAADVLTFYQERIANEGFLRTATERRSVLELAREIGYELSPGVAASTWLAFTVETAPGSPRVAAVPTGTRVQSVPPQGKQPQTFETIEDLTAKVEWNDLRPLLSRPQRFTIVDGTLYLADESGGLMLDASGNAIAAAQIYLAGTAANLAPGDVLLVAAPAGGGTASLPVRALAVTVESALGRTRVDLLPGAPTLPDGLPAAPPSTGTPALAEFSAGNVRQLILGQTWTGPDLDAFLTLNRWDPGELLQAVAALAGIGPQALPDRVDQGVFAFRQKLGFFGHNAPRWETLPLPNNTRGSIQGHTDPYAGDWDALPFPSIWENSQHTDLTTIANADAYLERNLPDLLPASWVLFATPPPKVPFLGVVPTATTLGALLAPTVLEVLPAAAGLGLLPAPTSLELLPAPTSLELLPPAAGLELLPAAAGLGLLPPAAGPAAPLQAAFWLTGTTEESLVDYGLSGKCSGLLLTDGLGQTGLTRDFSYLFRTTSAYVQSDRMPLSPLPIVQPLPAGTTSLMLSGLVLGLTAGRAVALSGQREDAHGVQAQEALTISGVQHQGGRTVLSFQSGLRYAYIAATVTINANVARSTHGETTSEVLGSGDSSRSNQSFRLKKPPLTYVSAPTASGAQSTLALRVNGVLWQEAPSLFALDSHGRGYVVRRDDAGQPAILFGDGVHGARVPSGQENVAARYRSGIGLDGDVAAGSLTTLLSRPLGIRGAANPVPGTGAADPQTLDAARENAPLTVRTLDRIVSLDDFEDFARAFAGIGKAQATPLWDGRATRVHLTVADAKGGTVDSSSAVFQHLVAAIDAARIPLQRVQVAGYQPLTFRVTATLVVDGRILPADVHAAALAALAAAFSFERRAFGQPVTAAELMTVLQQVRGVLAVELQALAIDSGAFGPPPPPGAVPAMLPAHIARFHGGTVLPAELLLVNSSGIHLQETSA